MEFTSRPLAASSGNNPPGKVLMSQKRNKNATNRTQTSGKCGIIAVMKDRLIFVSTLGSVILNIILWLVVAGKFGLSRDRITLPYSAIYGTDFLGSARNIYLIPLAGLAVAAVNSWLAWATYRREKLFAYMLSFAGFVA